MPKYTELRGSVYWFKRRAPKPLLPGTPLKLADQVTAVGKNGYVKFSLRTSDARLAAKLARKFAHLLDDAVGGPYPPTRDSRPPAGYTQLVVRDQTLPTAEEIQFAADTMYADLLAADEQLYQESVDKAFSDGDGSARTDDEGDEDDEPREAYRFELSPSVLPPMTPAGQVQLLTKWQSIISFYLYQTTQKTVAEQTSLLLPFADALRRLAVALEQRKNSVNVPSPPRPERPAPSFTLSVLYEKFKTYNITQKTWKDPETQDSREYGPVIREFIRVVGDKPVQELNRQDAEKYFEHTIGRTDIQLGTKKRNFSRVKAVLNYGKKKHSVPDILGPLELDATYKKTHNSYERFTPAELQALFHSEAYKKNTFKKASDYWLPLIGLYTGARIDEIASLLLSDVKEIKGVWCYFMSSHDANAGGKNEYAPRWVPIHPEVLKAGFLDHWRRVQAEGHQRLFPEFGLAKRDGAGKRATVDFTEYRRSVGVGATEGRSTKVFHSFRSTLVSELVRRKTDDYMRHKVLGHSVTESDTKFKGVHFDVYDQSEFDAKLALKTISKANFGLTHPKFCDSPQMIAARARYL